MARGNAEVRKARGIPVGNVDYMETFRRLQSKT